VERERAYLLAHRVHDEFWYAARFGLPWPKRTVYREKRLIQFPGFARFPRRQLASVGLPNRIPSWSITAAHVTSRFYRILTPSGLPARIRGAMLTLYLQLSAARRWGSAGRTGHIPGRALRCGGSLRQRLDRDDSRVEPRRGSGALPRRSSEPLRDGGGSARVGQARNCGPATSLVAPAESQHGVK
jgi:hypothetical protein